MKRFFVLFALLLMLAAAVLPPPAAAAADEVQSTTFRFSLFDRYPEYHYMEYRYRIEAEAGPLTLTGTHFYPQPAALMVAAVLVPGETEPLGIKLLTTVDPTLTVELPAAGPYDLWVQPVFEARGDTHFNPRLTVTARGLTQLGRDMPAIYMNDFGEYDLLDAPRELRVFPGDTAVYLSRIALNGEPLYESDDPATGGWTRTITLNPAQLPEGPHLLEVHGSETRGSNRSYTYRTFLVDREDQFTDVPRNHWARQPVELMAHMGILAGRGNGTFDPAAPVLRKEFAKMVALTFGLEATGEGESPFADAPGDWSQPYIDALYEAGLVQGELVDGLRYFRPDRSISRAEAVTIIGRALGIDQANVSFLPPIYVDEAAVPAWAWPSVAVLSVWRWVGGFPDGTFGPGALLQRAQAAKILAMELGLEPVLRDSATVRPEGIPSGWMHRWGWQSRIGFNPWAEVAPPLEQLWLSNLSPSYRDNMVAGNGLLFVGGSQGRIYAVLPGSGQVLWRTAAGRGFGATVAYSAAHNLVYASVDGERFGKVVALHPVTGRIVWEAQTGTQTSLAEYSPVVAGDLVLVAGHGYGSTIFAFDARTGALVWSRDSGGLGQITADGERVYQGNAKGQVFAYRLSDGAPAWERRNGWSGHSPTVVAAYGLVMVVDSFDRVLIALDAETGELAGQMPGIGQVAVDDRYLWVPQPTGGILVLDVAAGEVATTVPVCNGTPVIGATHAFVACNGQILAIDRESFAVEAVAQGTAVLGLDWDRVYYLHGSGGPGQWQFLGALGPGPAPEPAMAPPDWMWGPGATGR